jgi:hypothetical protein
MGCGLRWSAQEATPTRRCMALVAGDAARPLPRTTAAATPPSSARRRSAARGCRNGNTSGHRTMVCGVGASRGSIRTAMGVCLSRSVICRASRRTDAWVDGAASTVRTASPWAEPSRDRWHAQQCLAATLRRVSARKPATLFVAYRRIPGRPQWLHNNQNACWHFEAGLLIFLDR